MNTAHAPSARMQQEQPVDFLLLVDFKWLMAGQGWWIDLTRLQRDAAYAEGCIASALASPCRPLRERAEDLQARCQEQALAH